MAATEQPGELLARIPLFSGLSETELRKIADVAIPRSYPAGTRVFHEGDEGDSCYVVRSGTARVTRQHTDGRAITLATFGPGEFFGELAMLDGEVRSATAEAIDDVELLALPATDVRGLLQRNPEITVKLVVGLTRRLRDANDKLARQSFQTVPSRVAGVLLRLVSEEPPGAREPVTVRMRQSDLAQLAGTSRESASRFLATLERAGVIAVGRGRVTVLDADRLRSYVY